MKPRVIAIYLPQFHPIPENDKWYGEGFTEWTNVINAKPLFKDHYQPIKPHKDLGYYDLRDVNVIKKQVDIAKKYGVEAFCFYHYWFGNKKRLLEKPFNLLLSDKSINFPFCLAWANHSWEKKLWDPKKDNEVIVKQEYLGNKDFESHFYEMLDAFKDPRYLRVNNKLFFLIYDPFGDKKISDFIKLWRILAQENDLNDFYFVGTDFDLRNKSKILNMGFDAVYNENALNIHHHLSFFQKFSLMFKRKLLKKPTVFKYRDAVRYMLSTGSEELDVIPSVAPNWDHSPRSKNNAMILRDSNPILFKKILSKAFRIIINKPVQNRIVLIKSWNEWGEGNYLEPDSKFDYGYLEALKSALDEV